MRRSVDAAVAALALAAACGDNLAGEAGGPDGGGDPGTDCQIAAPGPIEPLWIAGRDGPARELGRFGKADPLFITDDGILLVGDEHPDYEELHLFDLAVDDPAVRGDELPPLADLGGAGGGAGPLEFRGLSGFAADRETGALYLVEQGNSRVQVVRPLADPRRPPYLVFDSFLLDAAADPDRPADGELVRVQAARVDQLGRLYLSDDARVRAPAARRDIQVFSREGLFLHKLGDASYGARLGVGGRLAEPENFAIDEARGLLYVCDEGPRDVAVYRYDDRSFVTRFGGFTGIPNGVDIDPYGFIYVVDEGDDREAWVRIFDPDTLGEVARFGAHAPAGAAVQGAFHSPDSIVIDAGRDLLLVADQGHDRVQAFPLSEAQGRACIATLRLLAPAFVRAGQPVPLRIERHGPDRQVDRSRLRHRVGLRAVDGDGASVPLDVEAADLRAGAGVALVTAPDRAGPLLFTVTDGAIEATAEVQVVEPSVTEVSGALAGDQLTWTTPGTFLRLSGETIVPAGATLAIGAGVQLLLDPGATLLVDGAIDVRGTQRMPVQIGASDPGAPWSQIRFRGAAPSRLRHVFITGGGDAARTGHCCPPMLLVDGAALLLEETAVTASRAKGLFAGPGSTVEVRDSIFAHLGMGAEFHDASATLTRSHFTNFTGEDDNDAVYLRGETAYLLDRSVFADVDDDAIDTLASSPTVTECLVYGAADKGLSLDAGRPEIQDSLIAGTSLGVSFKNLRTAASSARVQRTTIVNATDACVDVANADGATVQPSFSEVIVWGCGESFRTAYDPADLTVEHSLVQPPYPAISGSDNLAQDPLFLETRDDFTTHTLSPARTAGADSDAVGWPGP